MEAIRGGRHAAAVGQMLYQFEAIGTLDRNSRTRLTASQVAKYAAARINRISTMLNLAPKKNAQVYGGVPFLAFVLLILSDRDAEAAKDFIDGVVLGTGLEAGSPMLRLRDRFASQARLTRGERLELLIKGWNAWRAGEKPDRFWIYNSVPPISD
jgi:hypothetical protein